MIKMLSNKTEDVIELQASGKMTRADYDELLPRLESLFHRHHPVRFYVELHDFKGWEPGAFWDELKFDIRHRRDFSHMAVVGGKRLATLGVKLSNLLFSSEVRHYDSEHADAARAWVREPDASLHTA